MKKFISFTLLTLFTSHIYAIQLKNSEYGFELGGNKYFQESEEGLVISNDGNIKKLNITPGMMPEIYKLSEPPRDCRRLNILREYDNENTKLHS